MKIIKIPTNDGRVIRGLLSEATVKDKLIIHFHGFGSDCFANSFLELMHKEFPSHGISFLSVNTRYSGYLVEEYSENNVHYSGASIDNYRDIENDVNIILKHYQSEYKSCILQGHSFGTNLVKLYLRKSKKNIPAIFLAPADSVGLYEFWKSNKNITEIKNPYSAYIIRTDIFGMRTDYGEYRIPITDIAMKNLLTSEIFNEWSLPVKTIKNNSLVIKGKNDLISNFGATKNLMHKLLTNSECYFIDGAKHIFSNYEGELFYLILSWLRKKNLL